MLPVWTRLEDDYLLWLPQILILKKCNGESDHAAGVMTLTDFYAD